MEPTRESYKHKMHGQLKQWGNRLESLQLIYLRDLREATPERPVNIRVHKMSRTTRRGWFTLFVVGGLVVGLARPARAQLEEAAAAYEIYQTYSKVIGILESGDPTPDTKILAQLDGLKSTMQAIDTKLQTLDKQVADLVYETKRADYLRLLLEVQTQEAFAQTAMQQLLEWVQTGKTDQAKLANAENNSQNAANTLLKRSYYMRPGSTATAPDIFEYRTTLVPYLYVLTVRLAVVAVEQPHFRKFSAYTDEFKAHVAWLKQVPALLETEISCGSSKQMDDRYGVYAIVSHCRNILSDYSSVIAGWPSNGWNDYITPWVHGSATEGDSAQAYYAFYDRWHIQEEMGEHAVQRLFPLVVYASTLASPRDGMSALNRQNGAGPLANGGKCLDSSTGLSVTKCNRGSSAQQWFTAADGVVSRISSAHPTVMPDECLEVHDWGAGLSAYPERCSGSSGENWVLTAANEIRWNRKPNLCLTSDLSLLACNGASNQWWFRTWPGMDKEVNPNPSGSATKTVIHR